MKKVAIIGMGTMGNAIAASLAGKYEVSGLDRTDDISTVSEVDIVIIAVKPQSFQPLSHNLRKYIEKQTVLSVMAGVRIGQIAEQLNTKSVIRCMPNLALAKAKSLTGVYVLSQDQIHIAEELLHFWGQVIWLNKEDDFDAFTAIAGSGPAYFFEMVHQLKNAAEKHGLSGDQARRIANAAFLSAAAVLEERPVAEMVKAVTSKGGTTAAALSVFGQYKFKQMINEAVTAATARSKELSQ